MGNRSYNPFTWLRGLFYSSDEETNRARREYEERRQEQARQLTARRLAEEHERSLDRARELEEISRNQRRDYYESLYRGLASPEEIHRAMDGVVRETERMISRPQQPERQEVTESSTLPVVMGYRRTRGANKDLSDGSTLRVGYEIEKNSIFGQGGPAIKEGDFIGEYEVFRGVETDSSCGVEAITHILPLSTNTKSMNRVKKMFKDASSVINSPANGRCGGHISVSHKQLSSGELLALSRGNLSILYALYRGRLRNTYSSKNKWLSPESGARGVVNICKNRIEIRLPSAVKNVNQLVDRHELMAIIMEHSIEHRDKNFVKLLKKLNPLFMRMYKNDLKAVKKIRHLSKLFRSYILDYKIHDDIKKYVDKITDDRGRIFDYEAASISSALSSYPQSNIVYSPRQNLYRGTL